jgi:site-specific recombinase XerD
LEQDRGCSIATRNVRLAAIHALARFVGEHCPEYIGWCSEVRAIPFKKASKPDLPYLEKHEMDALLDAPDRNTAQGFRDYSLLLFLYNTGARADEAAHLKIADLDLNHSPSVKIIGKGNKTRLCPLWSLTAKTLQSLITGRMSDEQVFVNRRKQPITRYGIHYLVKRYVSKVSHKILSLRTKRVSTHTIRHTTAVHLLRAGVDINTIRAWLGHVSLDTTNIYAEVDLEMKARALAHCEIYKQSQVNGHWRDNRGLMAFLKSL